MSTVIRYLVALNLSRQIPLYTKECRAILGKMMPNPLFADAAPFLAKMSSDVDALDAAEQATHDGPKGTVSGRNDKLLVVKADMRQLKAIVQSAADANPAEAKTIIESAGMNVVKRVVNVKADITAKNGKIPGTVNLYARAVKGRASYQWQVSTDQHTWTDLPPTIHAKTTVTGLTPATVYAFRFRSLTAAGLSEWSTVVTIIAH
jgi:hypothetical protein